MRWIRRNVLFAAGGLLLLIALGAMVVPTLALNGLPKYETYDEAPCGNLIQSWQYPAKPTTSNYAPWLIWDDFGPTKSVVPFWKKDCLSNYRIEGVILGVSATGGVVLVALGLITTLRRRRLISNSSVPDPDATEGV